MADLTNRDGIGIVVGKDYRVKWSRSRTKLFKVIHIDTLNKMAYVITRKNNNPFPTHVDTLKEVPNG